MTSTPHSKILSTIPPILAITIVLFSIAAGTTLQAQEITASVSYVRMVESNEAGVANPAGLAFSSSSNTFYVAETRGTEQTSPIDTEIFKLTPFGDGAGSVRIALAIDDTINMAFDGRFHRLLIYQSQTHELIEVMEGAVGQLDPATLVRHDARGYGVQNPQGMAVDPVSGHLFILDSATPRLVRIEPTPDGAFDGAAITEVNLLEADLEDPRGLALDPTTEHLHTVSTGGERLTEFTQTGQVVALRDLSELQLRRPQGMVFAPSADLTDDPAQMSLFMTDSMLGAQQAQAPNTIGNGSPASHTTGSPRNQLYLPQVAGGASGGGGNGRQQAAGRMMELTFGEAVQPQVWAAAVPPLVQTINAWQWSPPSPDSSGIVYLPATNALLVSDAEVNEMPIFTGANLFQSSLNGNLLHTSTTLSFSDEPNGATLNPSNGHLFFSDDTGTRSVYELNPGADGLYNTPDDIVTSFATASFGSSDPEGVTYATDGSGVLYVVDGVNREIYRVHPGANGLFDGVGDQVTSFDTLALGLDDPEGIAFNLNTGTLYAIGKPSTTLFELTTAGALVQMIDISAANARKPAGLTLGPGSRNPGELSIYIVDRGVDNNSDPSENDGRVYEFALGQSTTTPPPNDPPLAVDNNVSTPEDTAKTINVAANDSDPNGNLSPASANTNCATCSIPTSGTLISNWNGTFNYTPNLNFNGIDNFVYEICDTQGACDTASVTITVDPVVDPPLALDDSVNTSVNRVTTIDVALNDSDPDGNLDPASTAITCVIGSPGCVANGTIANKLDGTFTYTPTTNFIGSDSFVYEIRDTLGVSDTASVNITVTPLNDPPLAVGDSVNTSEDTAKTIDVTINDGDPDGNLAPASANTTCFLCSNPAHGALANNGNGSFSYTPSLNFNGSDGFVYEICDILGACDTAPVTITVAAVADPPQAVADITGTPEEAAKTIDVSANDSDPDGNLNPASTNNTCATCSNPINGALANNHDGTFTYTPNLNYNGSDGFIYEICDTLSACDTSSVVITVYSVADPPLALDNSASTLEDTLAIIDVAANDSDPDGNLSPASANTTCATCSNPISGTLVSNWNGTFTYTPSLNFNGSDSFVYAICDFLGMCDTATVTITVDAVADPPLAFGDNVNTSEDTAKTIDVAVNDTDPEGNLDPPSANSTCAHGSAGCVGAANGTLADMLNGAITYTPTLNFNGKDSFVYEICDSGIPSLCNTATVTITVDAVADPPLAFGDNVNTSEDTAKTIDVSANDSDPDGNLNPASARNTSNPINGALANNHDGTFTYTPNLNYNGSDSFVYELCDSLGACDTAPVTITVNAVADPPLTVGDSAGTPEETAKTIDVAANDSDPDGNLDPTSANTTCANGSTGCAAPANGTLVNNLDGTFSYTPILNFNGSDNFVYEICDSGIPSLCNTATVSITVEPVADPPVAVNDSAGTSRDARVTINVAANDSDPDENLDPASANITCANGSTGCAGPAHGSLANNGPGVFTYTPNPNFDGSDSFIYEICDTDKMCDTATVSIIVDPMADPPVAVNDSTGTLANKAVTIDVAANDSDADGNLDPASANITCANGSTGCAGPTNGTLVNHSNGAFTYTPNPNFSGSDSFVYEICDTGKLCDTATVSITVDPVTNPPVAVNDSAGTSKDAPVTINVAANDSDADGNLDPTSANITCANGSTGCVGPANGSLVNHSNGAFTYTPNPNFSGSDSFVYEICDTGKQCDTATVNITVDPVADPPVAVNDSAGTSKDAPVTINVAANDSDADGNLDPASANITCANGSTGCVGPANGTLVNHGNGAFTYTPNPNFTGSDSFVYEICDTGKLCDTATVSITVDLVADPPLAVDDNVSTLANKAVAIDVAANDSDPDGNLEPASANITCANGLIGCVGPANGSLALYGSGLFDYRPNLNFTGSDSFVYEICDTGKLCDTATVRITVNPVADDDNDPPSINVSDSTLYLPLLRRSP